MVYYVVPILITLFFAACADPSPPSLPSVAYDARVPPTPDVGAVDATSRLSEIQLAADRAACGFGPGAVARDTIGAEYPIGDELPFDHIILLMQENRSFDHYFGTMPGVDGFGDDYQNLDSDGLVVRPYHETRYCVEGVSHSWNGSHRQYNNGANDGFVRTNDPNGARALGYYDDSDLPFYWGLYSTFAMSNRHFASVLGPTWVNRFYSVAGTSFGLTANDPLQPEDRPDGPHLIYHQLDEASVDWKIYFESAPFILAADTDYVLANRDRVRRTSEFFEDLQNGALAPVSWVDPRFAVGVETGDEHPPGNVQAGQAWVAEVVNAVMASPSWERTVIVLTYDEHGGFFDHVPPPAACHPGDRAPNLEPGDEPGDFDRLGFRVPIVVISPYSRAGYVSERVTDLTSVLRLVQTRFGLPALTGRDANAWPLLDMFDFENPPFLVPPELSQAVIDPARQSQCEAEFD